MRRERSGGGLQPESKEGISGAKGHGDENTRETGGVDIGGRGETGKECGRSINRPGKTFGESIPKGRYSEAVLVWWGRPPEGGKGRKERGKEGKFRRETL